MRPVALDKSVTRFELEMGGQQIAYSHCPKFWQDVTWPGDTEADFVRIQFEDTEGDRFFKDYEGPWGWFRLLQDSRLTKTQSANIYNVSFTVDGRKAQFRIKANSVTNPFNTAILSRFDFPGKL